MAYISCFKMVVGGIVKAHITDHRSGFSSGYTSVTKVGEPIQDTGIEFGVLKLDAQEEFTEQSEMESAYLLMQGQVAGRAGQTPFSHRRGSLFEDAPFCVHVSKDTPVTFKALSPVEIAICRTVNHRAFAVEIYGPERVPNEHRGAGQVDGACLRWVRTIFDDRSAHPNSQLVLGEVVNFPGRWSSYPPHHHPQPEIYHYRFTDASGYGHGELGDRVFKIRPYDTLKILDSQDHAQCSAPGYGMYYLWVIRHLPNERYTVPEFTEEHRWTMAPDASFWRPEVEVT